MNAATLLSQPIPRSREIVQAYAAQAWKPFRKLADAIGLGLLAAWAVALIVFANAECGSSQSVDSTALAAIVLIGIYAVLLPWLGLRWLARRDLTCARRLAKRAPAYRATLVGCSEPNPGLPVATLSWEERGRFVGGHFELIKPVGYKPEDCIVVLAQRRRDRVLAVFGDGAAFVGHRLYRWQPPQAL
jgi:hypothetical protein